ncbi:putative RNA-directed DNA polymerase [Tanacetum coccineum]
MEQPEGVSGLLRGRKDFVCRLQKKFVWVKASTETVGLQESFEVGYRGKQASERLLSDHCVFFSEQDLSKSFAMKDLEPAKQILGIRIFRDRGAKKLHISQEQYIEKVLRRFNMDKAKVVSSPLTPNFKLTDKDCPSSKKNIEKMDRVPYASAVGSLMYAMVCTRPDLAHAVGVVSRFLSNPGKKHWEAVKWIFRYLRGTSKLGITFGNGKPMLVGYTDSDLAGNKDNMKSTSGYLMNMQGEAVSWMPLKMVCFELNKSSIRVVMLPIVEKGCAEKSLEDLLLVRRDGELILIDRKWGRFVGYFLSP